jgi:hypothetical protein
VTILPAASSSSHSLTLPPNVNGSGPVVLTDALGNGVLSWAAGGGGGGTPGNPTAVVGLTVVNGSATTYMRSDAAPPLSQGIAPTWTGQHTWSAASGGKLVITGDIGGGDPPDMIRYSDASGRTFTISADSTPTADGGMAVQSGSSGYIVTTLGAQSLAQKTLTTSSSIRVSSVGSGCALVDNASTGKKLYWDLTGAATGNHGIKATTTAPRNWTLQDCAGSLSVVGNEASPPSTNNLGKVDRTGITAVTAATLLTPATAIPGVYAVFYEMWTTTATALDGVLTFDTIATGDAGAKTISSSVLPLYALGAICNGVMIRNVVSGGLQYSTTLSAGPYTAATTRTALRVRVEYLG